MKNIYITKLILENVRNLDYTVIPLANDEKKHLIFTGRNGSGKTTVLEGLSWYLDALTDMNAEDIKNGTIVEMNYSNDEVRSAFKFGKFIIAYYEAERNFSADAPNHVSKVRLEQSYAIYEKPRKEFIKYLLDLKMTQALAATNGKQEKAQGIQEWFDNFEQFLQNLFENNQLHLEFDEDTFQFTIQEPEKEAYDFNTLSSGYAAALDIVVDIMIRMEKQTNRKFRYDLPGIVLIDEIATHLHLELQKKILGLLTTMFPNIQFIVTTHSPFILNSLENVVIYDLEQHLLVENGLADIPYDGIVEGYFKADKLSDKLKEKFARYQILVHKETLTDNDFEEIANLEMFLEEIPDYLALGITTEYQRLKLEFSKREDIDG